jgi:hypothetical protein
VQSFVGVPNVRGHQFWLYELLVLLDCMTHSNICVDDLTQFGKWLLRNDHTLYAKWLRYFSCAWIAESVENVLHVAWLPDRCMTASHFTSV